MTDLRRPDRPRSSTYDTEWLLGLDMGPHPLWRLEELLPELWLEPGMRVLDLGSGRGATSVFLARECEVDVVAADLWVTAEDAAAEFARQDLADRITAVHVDARSLPFADQEFDAVVSIDAWEYFGDAPGVLEGVARVLRPGGRLAVATVALHDEPTTAGEVPSHVRAVVGDDALTWHAPGYYPTTWTAAGAFADVSARHAERGWQDWLDWEGALAARDGAGTPRPVLDMLRADGGRSLSFALVAATRR